jgi:hypothetical protein
MAPDDLDLRRQQVRDASIDAARTLRARTGSSSTAYAATIEATARRTKRAARSTVDVDDRQLLLATAIRQRRLAQLDRALADRSSRHRPRPGTD